MAVRVQEKQKLSPQMRKMRHIFTEEEHLPTATHLMVKMRFRLRSVLWGATAFPLP